ncbi:glycosyltransferase [Sporolactobacillus terrae]|uniref:Glycosyl transferase family 2 n=1 Tax=Sporolactobacillus terrae TaxID=269673 RepID=A0A410D776_9BACL|nr:glycosyltransferase [Sporolactobacillus terrae]QAA21962.1 tetratricopeptide repeat protein [Sporolactobacillus terrae]QAA24935.1 tetratricopeptide repeat protein [Sporolactobacillus terrae]BBN98239.1 glycosyl transferase family 2 [Sporolactobacillus terrae]
MKPFLTLCMIVKNEEKVLKRCLGSVFKVVDEIIIVDTGSTDNTKAIAKKFTKKVYDYKWIGSFSNARNFAQSKATGEWILVLDADEFCQEDNALEFKKYLMNKQDNVEAYDVLTYHFLGNEGASVIQNKQMRVYRNISDIHYIRSVHEQLINKQRALNSGHSTLLVYHSGYMRQTIKEKKKHTRNKKLIDQELLKNADSGFDYFNLGNEYSSIGEDEKALENYIKAYQLKRHFKYSWVSLTIVSIVNCLINLKRYSDALDVIRDSEEIYSRSPEFRVLKSVIYLRQGRLEDAKNELETIAFHENEFPEVIVNVNYLIYIPYKVLSEIYTKQNQIEKAVQCFIKALDSNLNDTELLYRFFRLVITRVNDQEIITYLTKLNFMSDVKNVKRFIKVLTNLPGSLNLINKILRIEEVDKSLIRGIQPKIALIKDESEKAMKIFDSMNLNTTTQVINEGIFDFLDYIILCFILNKKENLLSLSYGDEENKNFVSFLCNGQPDCQQNDGAYLLLLERTINLNKFDLFEKLLSYRTAFDDTINIKIGHLLYEHDFIKLAMSFYQEVDISLFDENTYINIINEFIKKNELEDAYRFALQAINSEFYSFGIVKQLILLTNHSKDNKVKFATRQFALKCFPDSEELKNAMFNGIG